MSELKEPVKISGTPEEKDNKGISTAQVLLSNVSDKDKKVNLLKQSLPSIQYWAWYGNRSVGLNDTTAPSIESSTRGSLSSDSSSTGVLASSLPVPRFQHDYFAKDNPPKLTSQPIVPFDLPTVSQGVDKKDSKSISHIAQPTLFSDSLPPSIARAVEDNKNKRASREYGEELFASAVINVLEGNFSLAYFRLNQFSDNSRGIYSTFDAKTGLYLRNAIHQNDSKTYKEKLPFSAFAVMGLNYFHTALKIMDKEKLLTDEKRKEFLLEANKFLNDMCSHGSKSEINSKNLVATAVQDIIQKWLIPKPCKDAATADKMLSKNKDFCNTDQSPYTLVTVKAINIKNNDEKTAKSRVLLHIDAPIPTKTDVMIKEYEGRRDKAWYKDLKQQQKAFVDDFATRVDKDLDLAPTLATQMRSLKMPGNRNAGCDRLFISDQDGWKLLYRGPHMASPGFKDTSDEAKRLTRLNLESFQATMPALVTNMHTLITPMLGKEGELDIHNDVKGAIEDVKSPMPGIYYSNTPANVGRTFLTPELGGVYAILNYLNILLEHGEVLNQKAYSQRKEFWSLLLTKDGTSLNEENVKAVLNEANQNNRELIKLIQTTIELLRLLINPSKQQKIGDDPRNQNVQLVAKLKQAAYLIDRCMSACPVPIQAKFLCHSPEVIKDSDKALLLPILKNKLDEYNVFKQTIEMVKKEGDKNSDLNSLQEGLAELEKKLEADILAIKGNKAWVIQLDGCVSAKDREGIVRLMTLIDATYHEITGHSANLNQMDEAQRQIYTAIAEAIIETYIIQMQAGLHGGTLGAEGIKSAAKMLPQVFDDGRFKTFVSLLDLATSKYNHNAPELSGKKSVRDEKHHFIPRTGNQLDLSEVLKKFYKHVAGALKSSEATEEPGFGVTRGRMSSFFQDARVAEIRKAIDILQNYISKLKEKNIKLDESDVEVFYKQIECIDKDLESIHSQLPKNSFREINNLLDEFEEYILQNSLKNNSKLLVLD